MKSFLVVAILVVAAKALSDQQEWEQFKIQHGKSYRSLLEEKRRFEIFKSNLRMIEEHNRKYEKGESGFTMRINQFGDMTQEEFKQLLKLQKEDIPSGSDDFEDFDGEGDLPETVDWREKGAVTGVKDQGPVCGSCWAFSSVGAIEGQLFLKNGTLVSLSAQNLVDCVTKEYGNYGCKGGWMNSAFNYTMQHGVLTEKEYPYIGFDQKCMKQGGVKLSGFQNITKGNETALAKAVATKGPVSIAIDAMHLMFYFFGVVDKSCGCKNDDKDLDHAVLIVGYGKSLFGEEYWIVKNSWGMFWGEGGYLRLKRNDGNTCGVASAASYPILA